MDEKVIKELLQDSDDVVQYLYSLLDNTETLYVLLRAGVYNKILMRDIEKVFLYDKKEDVFYLSDLPVNSEEDYVGLKIKNIVDGSPVFEMMVTGIEYSTIKYLYSTYIKIPFYTWLFKRNNKDVS